MQKVMQENCAVFRTGEVLAEGHERIHAVWSGSDDVAVSDHSLIWNSDLIETLEYDNLIVQAIVTMVWAEQPDRNARRTRARRYPSRDDRNWIKHTLAFIDAEERTVRLDDLLGLHAFTLTDYVQYIEPKARVY